MLNFAQNVRIVIKNQTPKKNIDILLKLKPTLNFDKINVCAACLISEKRNKLNERKRINRIM